MPTNFVTGQLVRLKSEVGEMDATIMVVRTHDSTQPHIGVHCMWLNKNADLQSGYFAPDMLAEG